MFFDKDELVTIAEVARTHGYDGSISLKIHHDFSDEVINKETPVFLILEGIPVPFFITQIRKGGNNIIVKLKNIDSEAKALTFIGKSVQIQKTFIEDSAEDVESFLYDYSVYDSKYGYIGKIDLFNEIPGNPVFETLLDGKTIIIPYNEDFILNIDHERKEVLISAPEGLIDLYLS